MADILHDELLVLLCLYNIKASDDIELNIRK